MAEPSGSTYKEGGDREDVPLVSLRMFQVHFSSSSKVPWSPEEDKILDEAQGLYGNR
jgi:hypothetical protein